MPESLETLFDDPVVVDDSKLTDEQWAEIVVVWNARKAKPPSIAELVQLVTKGRHPEWDGRTILGMAIRKRLSQDKLKASAAETGAIELTKDQKEYVANNFQTSTCPEMANILFKKRNLSNICPEVKAVMEFVKTINPTAAYEDLQNLATRVYVAPKTVNGAIEKINRYRHERIDKEALTGKQKKDINSLIGYLNTFRYIRQINTYKRNGDRELFEDTFIRYTHDKWDLTEEEVDQYILLAAEIITAAEIQTRKEMLNQLLTDAAEQEDPKISMSLVESIETANTEYDKCVTRQSKLLDSLKVKRSEKEGKDKGGAASIINLVQLWKDEESRKRMIKFAEKRKEILKKGAEELMSMDELKCRIVGLSMDEILNG